MRGKGAYGRALYVLCLCMYSVVLGMLHAAKKKEVVIWTREAIDLAQRPIFVYVCMYREEGVCWLLQVMGWVVRWFLMFGESVFAGVVVVALLLAVREVEFRTAFIPGGRIMTEWGRLRGK